MYSAANRKSWMDLSSKLKAHLLQQALRLEGGQLQRAKNSSLRKNLTGPHLDLVTFGFLPH